MKKALMVLICLVCFISCRESGHYVVEEELPFYATYNDCTAFSFLTVESLDNKDSSERSFVKHYVDFEVIQVTEHEVWWKLTGNALNPFFQRFDDIEYLLEEFVYDEECTSWTYSCENGGSAPMLDEFGTLYWFDKSFKPENPLQYMNWLFHGNDFHFEDGSLPTDDVIFFGVCGNRANQEFIFE